MAYKNMSLTPEILKLQLFCEENAYKGPLLYKVKILGI